MDQERQELQKIIEYYRLCYTADNRELNLFDFIKKTEKSVFHDSALALEGKSDHFPIETAWAKEILKELSIYTKEKELVFGAFFIMGTASVNGKRQRIFAPLLLYPASVEAWDQDHFVLTIETDKVNFNNSLLKAIESSIPDNSMPSNNHGQYLPNGYIRFDEIFKLESFLEKSFPNIDVSELSNYPEVFNHDLVQKLYSSKSKPGQEDLFRIIPALGSGIIQKSRLTRGVLNELQTLSRQDENYSIPLKTLFYGLPGKFKSLREDTILVPTILNQAQENVIKAMEKYPLSIIVGPPGTGKSFTIAGLAIHAMTRGMSVLIVSGNNQAVDVIADKIENDYELTEVCVRAGRKNYLRTLKKRLENLLSGVTRGFRGTHELRKDSEEVKELQKTVRNLNQSIKKLEHKLKEREGSEKKWGNILSKHKPNILYRFRKWTINRKILSLVSYWQLVLKFENDLKERNAIVKSLISLRFNENLNFTVRDFYERANIKDFLSGIRARTGGRQDHMFNSVNFRGVLSTFPIWLVSVSDISRVLPLTNNLFDLVIFDEATQCDTASALPILQRGKKVVVAGDPRQLRHLSFLSKDRQKSIASQLNLHEFDPEKLNFRENSLLDLALSSVNDQNQINFLNEHYRSHPDIIRFSNHEFYERALTIMTQTPWTLNEKKVFVHKVEGKRTNRGYNKEESHAILNKIKTIIDSEKNLSSKLCQSIGILSPFREQVNYIRKQVSQNLDLIDIERHRLLVGTAHSFQGEERDIMFISFAIDNDTHFSATRFINRDDVFNVSITRARSEQHIYLSATVGNFHKGLLRKYLESVVFDSREITVQQNDRRVYDPFLHDVVTTIKEWSPEQIFVNYPIAGLEIDIVVLKSGLTRCIDLIGYPGKFEPAFPIERYKMLNRLDILVFPLPYSEWHLKKEEVTEALKSFIESGEYLPLPI